MKKIALVASAIALLAGAANAAGANSAERPETVAPVTNVAKVDVSAHTFYVAKELRRAGLSADQTVSVTAFPSTGKIDRPSAND